MDSKIVLSQKEILTEWYNIAPNLTFSLLLATSYRLGYAVGLHDL